MKTNIFVFKYVLKGSNVQQAIVFIMYPNLITRFNSQLLMSLFIHDTKGMRVLFCP